MPKSKEDFIDLIEEQVKLYDICADLLLRPQSDPSLRTIAIASLHGQSGRRLVQEPSVDSSLGASFQRFVDAMRSRITDDNEHWNVRQLVNITSQVRFDQVIERILSLEGEHFELRALMDPHSLNVFSPLIISGTHSFLSLDDNRYFRASTALQFGSPKLTRWMLRYFDGMWNTAPFILRDNAGRNDDEIKRLEIAVQTLEQAQSTPTARNLESQIRPNEERDAVDLPSEVRELIMQGEGPRVEFKETLEAGGTTSEHKASVFHSTLKTVCAFLNSDGGTLLIGVHDKGSIVGLERDGAVDAKGRDNFQQKIGNALRSRFVPHPVTLVDIQFVELDEKIVARVHVKRTKGPTVLLDKKLYVRDLASTQELDAATMAYKLNRHTD